MFPDGNYLFAEGPILARLRDALGADVWVDCIGTTDALASGTHRFPGAYVLYAGDVVSEKGAGGGAVSQAEQHWVAAVGVKCAETQATGAKAREIAGKLFLKALEALQGLEVAPEMRLARTTCSLPVMYVGGHLFMAAEFRLTVNVVGGK
ncbi:MAG: DUF1834 family protein [Deltaproteobacteria bacterium]|nr:DUF1834 family protein [Deltaproteobacteria bacterium]